MFSQLFQLLLTELEGSFRFRVGNFSVGLVTTPGSNNFAITVSPYVPSTAVSPVVAAAASVAKSTASL
jgi:hypothetical protein